MKILAIKKGNRRLLVTLLPLFILAGAITVYSFLLPVTSTNQISGNNTEIKTTYDYKATVTPNVLYPDGGTIDVGNTIFRKITTSIPFHLKSTVTTENQVLVEGTHEAQLVIKAGDLWERSFPLEQKQDFKHKGKDISFVDSDYTINLEKIQEFITRVQDETGINSDQYSLEVIPNIQGTIVYDGVQREIQVQDPLSFQFTYGEITLSSEKEYTSTAPFVTSTETLTNFMNFMGLKLPIKTVRMTSSLLTLLLLSLIILFKKNGFIRLNNRSISQHESINKKYRNRIVAVSNKKININQKSIITLDSFQSILKVADEKELPIFFYIDHYDKNGVYFILDGDYLYNYETSESKSTSHIDDVMGSEKAYGRG